MAPELVSGLNRSVFNELIALASKSDPKRAQEIYDEALKQEHSKFLQVKKCPLDPDGIHHHDQCIATRDDEVNRREKTWNSKSRWVCECGHQEQRVSQIFKFNAHGALQDV